MRDPRARAALIGLMLAFPLLMALAAPRPSGARETALTAVGVEAVLVGGLLTAARARRLILAGRDPSYRDRLVPRFLSVAPRAAVRPSAR